MEMEVTFSKRVISFLLSLKQDIQFVNNKIDSERIEKSYFQPLSIKLINKNEKGEKNE